MRIEERARQAAESARFRLGAPRGRIDVFHAIRALGIHLLRWPLPEKSLEGAFARRGDAEFILVNSSKTTWLTRQRFTAAHELGHRFLSDDRSVQWLEPTIDRDDDVEANRFAAYFLMDEPSVRESVEGVEDPIARALNVAADFEVSLPASAIHLRELRLISPAEAADAMNAGAQATLATLAKRHGARQPSVRRDIVRDPGPDYDQALQGLLSGGLMSAERYREMRTLS